MGQCYSCCEACCKAVCTSANSCLHNIVTFVGKLCRCPYEEITSDFVTPNESVFLFLGLTGSGKTTAIESIFGIKLARADVAIANVVTEAKSNGTRLTILKAPSFQSSINVQENASVLVSITRYFDKSFSGCTGIFIAARMDDRRFAGQSSDFVKQLRAIQLLKNTLVNLNLTNIVLVLTFADRLDIQLSKPLIIKNYRDAFEKVFKFKPMCLVLGKGSSSVHDIQNQISYEIESLPTNDFYNLLREHYQRRIMTAGDQRTTWKVAHIDTERFEASQRYITMHKQLRKELE